MWFYAASGRPGVVSNSNMIEGHHSAQKRSAIQTSELKAPPVVFFHSTLPKILINAACSE